MINQTLLTNYLFYIIHARITFIFINIEYLLNSMLEHGIRPDFIIIALILFGMCEIVD